MRRPPRPFTVEIKSSRRPARIRKATPTLVDRPRAEPLFQDLLRGVLKVGQDRRPAQGAALSEADSVFSALATSAAGPVQPASLLTVAQEDPEVEAFSPEQPGRAERGAEPRQARVLPDLLSLSRASEPLSPAAEKRSALSRKQQSPGMQEWAEPGAARRRPTLIRWFVSKLASNTANLPR